MPEGHTVHRAALDLAELRGSAPRVCSPQGRFAEGARRVDGAVLTGVDAVGKHLFLAFDTGWTVHVHLGMRGKWLRSGDAGGAALPQVLDQSVLSGVGNVFRNEALHAIGVHPGRPGHQVAPDELDRLWSVLQTMMSRAVADGRIITVEAVDRTAVPEAAARRVYEQDRCRDCGAPVVVSTIGGRTAYHCSVEQLR